MSKQRADRLLVKRGLFESRARAQAAIAAGLVAADGVIVRKASEEISCGAVIAAAPAHPFVSRGGIKLAAALEHFQLAVTDRVCLDVGASTGGFTEVLMARKARRIYAVDIGSGQLHPRLRGNPRIVSIERTDIRRLEPSQLPEQPDLATIDVSFISLKLVLPAIGKVMAPRAAMIALIKPQFEAQRRRIRKGIVRDAAVQAAVCDEIAQSLVQQGWRLGGRMQSPILGGDGNREFFVEAQRG